MADAESLTLRTFDALEGIQRQLAGTDLTSEHRTTLLATQADLVKQLGQLQGAPSTRPFQGGASASGIQGAPGPAAVPVAPLAKLRALLHQCHVDNPNQYVMRKIESHYANRVLVIESAEAAYNLYHEVKSLPTTSVKAIVKDRNGITVNGCFSELSPSILSGATSTGIPLVIKLDMSAHGREHSVCRSLGLRPFNGDPHPAHLINCTALDSVGHTTEDPLMGLQTTEHLALVMPMYCCTLAKLPQLEPSTLNVGIARIKSAIEYIHSLGFVHMDVKSDNVFVDSSGKWFLGDFGSCVGVGKEVDSYTAPFHPEKLLKRPAENRFDYDMLLVMIAVEASKTADEWKKKLYLHSVLQPAAVVDACNVLATRSSELKVVIGVIFDRASDVFKTIGTAADP